MVELVEIIGELKENFYQLGLKDLHFLSHAKNLPHPKKWNHQIKLIEKSPLFQMTAQTILNKKLNIYQNKLILQFKELELQESFQEYLEITKTPLYNILSELVDAVEVIKRSSQLSSFAHNKTSLPLVQIMEVNHHYPCISLLNFHGNNQAVRFIKMTSRQNSVSYLTNTGSIIPQNFIFNQNFSCIFNYELIAQQNLNEILDVSSNLNLVQIHPALAILELMSECHSVKDILEKLPQYSLKSCHFSFIEPQSSEKSHPNNITQIKIDEKGILSYHSNSSFEACTHLNPLQKYQFTEDQFAYARDFAFNILKKILIENQRDYSKIISQSYPKKYNPKSTFPFQHPIISSATFINLKGEMLLNYDLEKSEDLYFLENFNSERVCLSTFKISKRKSDQLVQFQKYILLAQKELEQGHAIKTYHYLQMAKLKACNPNDRMSVESFFLITQFLFEKNYQSISLQLSEWEIINQDTTSNELLDLSAAFISRIKFLNNQNYEFNLNCIKNSKLVNQLQKEFKCPRIFYLSMIQKIMHPNYIKGEIIYDFFV